MKKKLLLCLLIPCLLFSACSLPAPPKPSAGIFHSDLTAIDFLEGLWTTNRGQTLQAARGDTDLIVWSTNLSLPSCHLYVLRDGTLYGGTEDGGELALLRFSQVDDDHILVEDLNTQQSMHFLREAESVDTQNLDNAYVFHSMRHALPYLSGMWMNESDNFFSVTTTKEGTVSFNSDLPCPQVSYIDFYEGDFCGFIDNVDGTLTLTPLFTFDIQSADSVKVHCHADGSESLFRRLSRNLEEAMLHADYVFSGNQQAFAFLDGVWGDPAGVYFNVTNEGGALSWKTNLPLDDSFAGYGFAEGGLQGITVDAEGNQQFTPIYLFEIHSQDEISITVCETGETHRLERAEARLQREAEQYAARQGQSGEEAAVMSPEEMRLYQEAAEFADQQAAGQTGD